MTEDLTVLQYEQMMKAYDPDLYIIRQQLRDLKMRKYGHLTCTWSIQAGKVDLMTREIKITNKNDSLTDRIKLIY
jgi:hypothetical protein